MYSQIKNLVQASFFVLGSLVLLAVLAWLFTPGQPLIDDQPGPEQSLPPSLALNGVALTGASSAQTTNAYLQISKTVNQSSVANGGIVQFTVTIRNVHPTDSVPNLTFIENPASTIIILGNPVFSAPAQPIGGPDEKAWIFDNPLAAGASVTITITAQLLAASPCDLRATNEVAALGTGAPLVNAKASVVVEIRPCLFMPLVRKDATPTPPPVATSPAVYYSDNFSNDDSDWPDDIYSDSDRCYSEYKDGEYRIQVDGDGSRRECFRPAPNDAEHTRALFEVQARRSGGGGSFMYGLYANGRGGGEYYLFRVRPNSDCGWELIRREDSDSDTVLSGGCDSAINRYSETNRLAIRHSSDDKISVYVNGVRLGTYDDNDALTGGKGTGVYVRSGNDEENTIRFDNFRVSSPSAIPAN